MRPDELVAEESAETTQGTTEEPLARGDVIFVLVVLGLASSSLLVAQVKVTQFATTFGEHSFLSRWIFVVWTVAFLSITVAAFGGSYRAIRAAHIDNFGIRFYAIAAMVFVGTPEWKVPLTPSLSYFVSLDFSQLKLGANVVGLALFVWFALLSERRTPHAHVDNVDGAR